MLPRDLPKPEVPAGKTKSGGRTAAPAGPSFTRAIHPLFLSYLAQIAAYAGLPEKYGDPLQYRDGRLHGGQGGVNHAREHLGAYQMGVGHDHFPADDPRWQLAAAAYNLMIEFVNLCDGRQPDTWQEKRKGKR